MMTSNPNITSAWRCSCNQANSLRQKRCKVCGDVIPENVLNQIYKEEIHVQNIGHAKEEEKRTIILAVIAGTCLLFAPLIIRLLIWLIQLLLLFGGAFSGIKSIINEYKKLQKVEINQTNINRWLFVVSVASFFVLIFMFGSWINASKFLLGLMAGCWLIFAIVHSVRVAKKKYYLSIPKDIVWCGVKFLLVVLLFAKTISI